MKLKLSSDFAIDSDQTPWNIEGIRLAIFGGPGSGKSWNAALLAEQWLDQGGTVVIFQPRAEYQTLKERYDIVVFGGPYSKDMDFLPVTPKTYARAVVEDGVSMIFYTSDVEEEDKLISFVSAFIKHLLKLQEVHKRPILLIIEESQEYAPRTTKGRTAPPWVFGRMIKAFRDCFLQGRKLNVSTIAVSPRPQDIDFSIRQLANLTLYGKFSRQDIGYIDRECFQPYKQKSEYTQAQIYSAKDLLDLPTGKWLMISGKEAKYITVTEPRKTPHGAETPKLTYTAPRHKQTQQSIETLAKSLKHAIETEQKEKSEIEKAKQTIKDFQEAIVTLKEENERLRTALEVAGKIKIEAPTPSTKETDYEAVLDEVRHILPKCVENLQYLLRSIGKPTQKQEPKTTPDIYQIWQPKLPANAQKIWKTMLDNIGRKYTKSELAVASGYSSRGGAFNHALTLLKRHHLIKFDKQFYWCE